MKLERFDDLQYHFEVVDEHVKIGVGIYCDQCSCPFGSKKQLQGHWSIYHSHVQPEAIARVNPGSK